MNSFTGIVCCIIKQKSLSTLTVSAETSVLLFALEADKGKKVSDTEATKYEGVAAY